MPQVGKRQEETKQTKKKVVGIGQFRNLCLQIPCLNFLSFLDMWEYQAIAALRWLLRP